MVNYFRSLVKGGLYFTIRKMKCIKFNNAIINIYGKTTKEEIEEATIKYLKRVDRIRKRGQKRKWEQQ